MQPNAQDPAPNTAPGVVPTPPVPTNSFSSAAYFIAGHGTQSTQAGTLSYNGTNLTLSLNNGHVVFDETTTNIQSIDAFSTHMLVHMPTGDASVFFADPKAVTKQAAKSALTGALLGGVIGATIASRQANKAGDIQRSESGVIAQWISVLNGKVKINGSATTNFTSTKKGMGAVAGMLLMMFGGLFWLGTFIEWSDSPTLAIVNFVVCTIAVIGGWLLYRKTSGAARERTSFPSSH